MCISLRSKLAGWSSSRQFRYLLIGGWNTIFGYGLMVILYAQFGDKIHIVVLSVVNNIFAISMSFMTYKVFVFKTRGNWLTEWMRSFVVYGGSATLSIALLWLLVDVMFINIYLAQALTILLVVIASYIGHSRFTFKQQGVSDD